jgi:glycosyltransferase involved in cell wall biosynthesis
MDISIILCTYNPDPESFYRSMKAIFSLTVPSGKEVEFVLVDNNSPEPVANLVAKQFLDFTTPFSFRIVTENTPGLLHARKKGHAESTGNIIVFFDDDNEPDGAYLNEVCKLYDQFPNIGVAGPANISVEYIGEVEPWLAYYKGYFQERRNDQLLYACYPHWLGFYPPGTGQTVRRSIYSAYLEKVENGTYSAIGRTKNSMASAEDVQLVFCAILMEYAVASVPTLSLNHLIASRKTSIPYLKRLLFGMSSSYPEAYAECFPHTRRVLPYYTNRKIFRVFWDTFYQKILIKKSPKAFIFQLAELLGKIYGSNHARGENKDSFWFSLITLLKLR